MRTFTPLFLSALLAACAVEGLSAAEPTSGKVLILDNDRTIEGDIERVGDQYHIHYSTGIARHPAARVLKLCNNTLEALAFLRQRANQDDPDEHLRLARWCHVHNLREEALKEVKLALEQRPDHEESRRLQRYLEQSAATPTAVQDPVTHPETTAKQETRPSGPPITITGDSLSMFASRIQPILMNACARCHSSSENNSAFRLVRSHSIGMLNRRAVQENLAAVLSQVHGSQPDRSPLLIKAISAHGPTGEAPIKGRQVQAFHVLEDWVKRTLETNTHLAETLRPTTAQTSDAPPPAPKKQEQPVAGPAPAPAPVRTNVPVTPSPTSAGPAPVRPVSVKPSPTAPAEQEQAIDHPPESEFDPVLFNRQFHPDRLNPKSGTPIKGKE
jgi:hypothetical protein